jgi:hypothetical protein
MSGRVADLSDKTDVCLFAPTLRVAVSKNRGENLKRRDISTDKDNIIFIPNGELFNYRSICQGSVRAAHAYG